MQRQPSTARAQPKARVSRAGNSDKHPHPQRRRRQMIPAGDRVHEAPHTTYLRPRSSALSVARATSRSICTTYRVRRCTTSSAPRAPAQRTWRKCCHRQLTAMAPGQVGGRRWSWRRATLWSCGSWRYRDARGATRRREASVPGDGFAVIGANWWASWCMPISVHESPK